MVIKHQLEQAQINKYNIRKNSSIVMDKLMLTNNAALKFETQYNESFHIIQCWTNETFILYYVA